MSGLDNAFDEERLRKLQMASEEIDTLIEEVEDTPKPPLNKENMVELAGCMVAGVFTAILRST